MGKGKKTKTNCIHCPVYIIKYKKPKEYFLNFQNKFIKIAGYKTKIEKSVHLYILAMNIRAY